MGIDQTDRSPTLQQKIVYAGIAANSFAQAADLLQRLADVQVDVKQVERLTERIGAERVAERDAGTAAFVALPLVDKFGVPSGVTCSEVAVAMADGGRLQILDRAADPPTVSTPATVSTMPTVADRPMVPTPAAADAGTTVTAPDRAAAVPTPAAVSTVSTVADSSMVPTPAAADAGTTVMDPEWHEEPLPAKGHWREDKVGLLLTMASEVCAVDPCPNIPASFLDVLRIPKLARQLKKTARAGEDTVVETETPEAVTEALQAQTDYQAPQVQTRRVLASRARWPSFAPQMAAAARELGMQGATRKAFVGDGSSNNWALQRRFFSSFIPILDFIHALSYVFAAAMAGRAFAVGWSCYQEWIVWVWQGKVGLVIAALRGRQAALGEPQQGEPETSPAQIVSKALTYLENQQSKMKYDEYRKEGLPITSSLMESTVKQINQRVKGTEKFWSEAGSEPVLQLRADQLSDGDVLEEFWQRRQEDATGQRPYRRSA